MVNLTYKIFQIELSNNYHCLVMDRHTYKLGMVCDESEYTMYIGNKYYKTIKEGSMTPEKWQSKLDKYVKDDYIRK